MPTIYLIRHAEPVSPYNWDDGDATRPLSQRGILQAKWMAAHLKGLDLSDFRTAPHQRCQQTAAEIAAVIGSEPEIDEALHISRSFQIPPVEGTMVWVAHSNNIPGAIHRFGAPGYRCGHASAWQLDFKPDGTFEQISYIEPEV